jgi:hypothetical protein
VSCGISAIIHVVHSYNFTQIISIDINDIKIHFIRLKLREDKIMSKIERKKQGSEQQWCNCRRMVKKKCLDCQGNTYSLFVGEKEYQLTKQIVEKVREIINNSQSVYEKKIALFDFLESLDVGKLKPVEIERVDYLLRSCLYGDLAKKNLEEYKKLTAKNFSKTE